MQSIHQQVLQSNHTHGSGISFSHDGKKMFKTDYEIDQIHQWTLSTAFDPTSISGSVTSANLDFDTSDNQRGDWPVGHAWNSDGTKLCSELGWCR